MKNEEQPAAIGGGHLVADNDKLQVGHSSAVATAANGHYYVAAGGGGSHSCSSSNSTGGEGTNREQIGAQSKPDLDYLAQLLKDKKQLSAFPNVFVNVERLVDEEINRVRVAIFQCEFSREPLQLPEPVGEVAACQEKVFVPVQQYPDYNFVGRILGPRGMTAKQLETETGCKIMVRGKGSMRDRKKEEANRGKSNWEHLNEDLHVIIQCEDAPNRAAIKIARAVEEVGKLLVPQPEGEDGLKRKQLMELAILNGTFRNSTSVGQQQPKSGTPLLQLDHRLLLNQALSSSSAGGLAGAPLVLPPAPLAKGALNQGLPLAAQSLNAQSQAQQTLFQLLPGAAGIFSTPGPYGLALPQGGMAAGSLDYLASLGQIQSQQSLELSALIQQQQLAAMLQQQGNGIMLGDYSAHPTNEADSVAGPMLSNQRRYIGHSRDGTHPYAKQN